ncbi:MAG: DUF5663 domain-containing protein [Candidatus Gracilibacteria bacterium]
MTPELRDFIDSMLTQAYGNSLDADVREIMIQDLYPRLEQTLSLAMLSKLSPDQLSTVEKMTDENMPTESIQAYVVEQIPDYAEVLEEALKEFWALYIAPDNSSEDQPAAA